VLPFETNDRDGAEVRAAGGLGWVLFLFAGCQNFTQTPPILVVDTLASGIVSVRNLNAGPTVSTPGFTLDHIVRVGSIGGGEETSFGRVVDALVGPGDVLYVLDAQSQTVQTFDLTGAYLGSFGGPGQGPGELASPYSLALDDRGQIWVADAGNRRYSVFTADGQALTSHAAPFRGGMARGLVRIAQGRVWDLSMLMERSEGPNGSVQMRSLGVGALGLAGEDALVPFDTIPLGLWLPTGLTRSAGSERLTMIPPYAPNRALGFAPDGTLWVGIGDQYAVHKVVPSGDTILIATREDTPAFPFDEGSKARVDEWFRSTREDGFDGDASVLPEAYPLFSRISVDDDGLLWIFRSTPGENSTEIDVFNENGHYLGSVPASIEIGTTGTRPRIVHGYLVGTSVDQLGVQYVEVFRVSAGR
jgi:hypothetical protein